MKKLALLLLAAALVAPAIAAPTYWNFEGSVLYCTDSSKAVYGNIVNGRFWGDPETDQLWELFVKKGDTLIYDTDFVGWTIKTVETGLIEAHDANFSKMVYYGPYTYMNLDGVFTLQVGSLTHSTGPAPAPIPAPGALLLGSMGVSLVGWLRRRRTL